MVVNKNVQMHIVSQAHFSLPAYGVRDLKIITVVVAAVKRLMKSIVCYRVKGVLIDPAPVLSVYDLAHQPEVLLQAACQAAKISHEALFQHICGIQSDPVDIEFRYPEADGIKMIIPYLRIIQVELWKKVMSSPCFIRKTVIVTVVSLEVNIAVPVSETTVFSVFLQVAKGKEPASGMIENSVKNDADTFLMAQMYKLFEIIVVSESLVDHAVVGSVIAVRPRREARTEVKRVKAAVLHVKDPFPQISESVHGSTVFIVLRRSQQTKRIYMIKNSIFIPGHLFSPASFYVSPSLLLHVRITSLFPPSSFRLS